MLLTLKDPRKVFTVKQKGVMKTQFSALVDSREQYDFYRDLLGLNTEH